MNKSYFYLEMKTHELVVPYTKQKRRVRVLLPKNYSQDTNKTYPVVYFHDGQNVLYSKESFSGHSWKVIPTIKRNPDIEKMIVVAIDNDGQRRMNEYAAWKFQESNIPGIQFGGKGTEYAEFVMEVVKPFIDQHYRTKSDRLHTAMIGSSLGGNISQFIGVEYQDQIGCLGIFSSANWLHQEAFDRYIERKTLQADQRVFIYVGTEEADDTDKTLMAGNIKQAYIDSSLSYFRQLLVSGADLAVKKLGLPLIAKPDNGVGAAATFKLETAEDVERFKQEWDHQTAYFFEKFVQSGEICTFDGLVDKDGQIVFATTFDYAHTPLDLMMYKMDNSYYVLKDMDPKLRTYGEAIVKIFGMKERFFHIEFFREGDDYVAIEYNNRPAGGFTIDVYNFAHSIDLYRGYAAIVAGEPFPAAHMEPLYCLATSRRASTNYAYPEADLLEKYRDNFKVKKDMPAAFAELQGDYLYMLTTPSREQMEQMIADFAKQAD